MASLGAEERAAVLRVLESGNLSGYLAGNLEPGPEVAALEDEWAQYFGVKHAVAMNSATSALMAAMGAIGLQPGDEVIIPALTMSASATCVLPFGGVPVWADIEPDYFCIDPKDVEQKITSKTRAIVAVDLFGQPFDAVAIQQLADEHNLWVIEDASQAPGARLGNRFAGTLGDIGIFSLNYHKHIHCGEGGVAVTDDDTLAHRLRLIANHGENASPYDLVTCSRIWGFNFRMTELQAAIAREQLKKLEPEIARRIGLAKTFKHLKPVRPLSLHAWYLYPFHWAAAPEGAVPYVRPLYSLPVFGMKEGICPTVEKVSKKIRVLRP